MIGDLVRLAVHFTVTVPTPTPTPAPSVNPNNVTPGPIGFAAIAFVGLAVILLIVDMVRRIRRVRYRAEIAEKLDAEQAQAGGVPDDGAPASGPGQERRAATPPGGDDHTGSVPPRVD